MKLNTILCRYSEIATKGKNRRRFEEALIQALVAHLSGMSPFKVVKERGRIYLQSKREEGFSRADLDLLRQRIVRVFGISSVSPAVEVKPELEAIETAVDSLFAPIFAGMIESRSADCEVRYAMRARRSDKSFPLSSRELEIHFAEKLLAAHPELTIDLNKPELCVQVEVRRDLALISVENYLGPGGLPSGTGGRVTVMLSGGIDSPVAAYRIMRRGCRCHFVTFHSEPYTPDATVQKVSSLARRLREFQLYGRLFTVNLLPAQKLIRDNCNPRFRTVLYRRLMVRIANRIARRFGARALVTGDNLGQVASQTLENLDVINHVADLPIFRPLLTFDKVETMKIAREIGTYEISKVETPDSCTVFAPDRPATATRRDVIAAEEEKFDYARTLEQILSSQVVELDLDTSERTLIQCAGPA